MGLLYAFSSLAPIKYHDSSPVSINQLYQLFSLNMSTKQYRDLQALRGIIDIKNLLSEKALCGFDPKGNYQINEFREKLQKHEDLPKYIFDFLEEYKDEKAFVKYFPKLYAEFFEIESKRSPLVSKILSFERELNLLLFGCYGKKRNISLESFLQFEDLSDPITEHVIMRSKNEGIFHFPYEYKELEEKIVLAGCDPMKQYEAVSQYRFNFYDDLEKETGDLFTKICAYMNRVWIIEDKSLLDEKSGRDLLTELLENEDE